MAWARPADAPQLPTCPLEALEPRPDGYVPFLERYVLQYGFGFGLGITPVLYNALTRRPIYAGIWKAPVFALVGYYGGLRFRNWRREWAAERDEVLRSYIELHPADFPAYERRLIKDLFDPWIPIR